MAIENATSFLPYHEPDIVTILIQASFVLLLNIAYAASDKVLRCGLVGQIFIGVAWGLPGAKWLSITAQETIVQLGYLGLILLVYEGGLNTSFQSVKANLLLSMSVALTGVALPIAFSFILQRILDASPLQAFAAGAALCSTSLGTTFAILGSSGLSTSRLGVVLTSAAMIDDVIGLIMVQIISNLGHDRFNWVTIVRPMFVSLALAITIPLVCLFLVKPATQWMTMRLETQPFTSFNRTLKKSGTVVTIHTLILIGFIAGANYAGTSNLFASYIAGASISWWDSELLGAEQSALNNSNSSLPDANQLEISSSKEAQLPVRTSISHSCHIETSGVALYQQYYHSVVYRILQPFFFASVGFSIPISRMFRRAIIWRALVYSTLMALAKSLCGLWLMRISSHPGAAVVRRWLAKSKSPISPTFNTRNLPNSSTPLSFRPAIMLAFAMCARGEIGFLISGVAESGGVFSSLNEAPDEPSDIFLVVTWAIVLCTIVGALGFGLMVHRVKMLENRMNEEQEGSASKVLGIWGTQWRQKNQGWFENMLGYLLNMHQVNIAAA